MDTKMILALLSGWLLIGGVVTATPPRLTTEQVVTLTAPHEPCLVVRELGDSPEDDVTLSWGGDTCDAAVSPCSTFKIPHALIALSSGVIADQHEVIPWDGKKRWARSWNRDHDLSTAIPNSVFWFFQVTARRLGPERMQQHLDRLTYGNRDRSSGLDDFWLDGSLLITNHDQVDFLTRLARRRLPYPAPLQRRVADLLVIERGKAHVLRGKTGSGRPAPGRLRGWHVGWLERSDRSTVVYALRLEGGEGAWGPEAQRRSRALLVEGGWLPGIAEATARED
ncbi:MAG: penicillin-binding transpeptidase domain-containing protein [Acidobacteriota bacterium]